MPDEDLDIYPEGFGLESVSLKTHQETREEVAAAVEDLAVILEEDTGDNGVVEKSAVEECPETVEDVAVEDEPESMDAKGLREEQVQPLEPERTKDNHGALKTVLIVIGYGRGGGSCAAGFPCGRRGMSGFYGFAPV